MSESAMMSAEDSMRSASLAKDEANSALSAAKQMRDLLRSEESQQLAGREVVRLQDDQVSSTAEQNDCKDDEETQPVFLSDPTAGIVDGGSDSEVETETAAIVDVLTSSDESEVEQTRSSVSPTDTAVPPPDLHAKPTAEAGQYIPSPIQVGVVLAHHIVRSYEIVFRWFSVGFVRLAPRRD